MVSRFKLAFIGGIIALSAVLAFIVFEQTNKKPYALEVDATKDTTDISGTMYRVRVANVGTHDLTGIVAVLGPGDRQTKNLLVPGETYFFYPGEYTKVDNVQILTNEGINVTQDYRSPLKTIGLPGTGR